MRNFLKKKSTLSMSREEWLELRRHSIGGSDAAAIIGLSKWASPYTVWADKTGRLPDKPDTEAMRQGRDLEEYVAQRFSEATEKRVKRCNAILYNPAYPHSHADVDRMIVGENAGLECKTTSTLDVKQFRGVEFPEKYYAQCVHYMAITGADRWYLAVLVLGKEFHVYTLERDEAEIRALMDAETAFWEQYVETDSPPAADGAESTTDAIRTIYSDSSQSICILFAERMKMNSFHSIHQFLSQFLSAHSQLEEYMALKSQSKALDARIAEIQNTIMEDMQDAERGECGAYTVIWKAQERETFQRKEFEKAHPEINLAEYCRVSKSRPFKVTENKE